MHLLVDAREPKSVLTQLNALNEQSSNKINIIQKNLTVGDYVFFDEINDKEVLIIERKSLADLESSIKDGRYKEQSFRLNEANVHNHNIIYLLEGTIINYKNANFKNTLYSTLFSLNYYKGFSVFNVLNQNETIELLLAIASKLMRENKPGFYCLNDMQNVNALRDVNALQPNYSNTLKSTKKSHITKDNIFAIMLKQIPGISNVSALALVSEFKTMENLLTSLKDCNANFETIKLESGRKINKTIIASLKDYLI
jgi:ERCC4-type nuclease